MQLLMYRPGTSAVWADALFASLLQRSDGPCAGQVREAVAAAMRAYSGHGCAERVAQEFGDHPETAVARMRWARGVVGEVFGAPESVHHRVRGAGESSSVRRTPPAAAVHGVVSAGQTGPGKGKTAAIAVAN
jgi:hypothetical protein